MFAGIRNAFYLQPILLLLAGVGLAAAVAPSAEFHPGWALVPIPGFLYLAHRWRRSRTGFCIVLLLAAFSFGLARASSGRNPAAESNILKLPESEELILEGRIDSVPEPTRHGMRFDLELLRHVNGPETWTSLRGTVATYLPERVRGIAHGDTIRVRAKLRRPMNFRTPGAFDYAGHLARRNIYMTAVISDSRNIAITHRASSGRVRHRFEEWRNRLDQSFEKNLSAPSAALARAFVIGRQGYLPDAILDDFRQAGVAHILSISGLHMAVVYGAAFWLVRWVLVFVPNLALWISVGGLAGTLAFVPTLFYLFLAGAEPPATRSAAMVLVMILCMVLERPKDSFHALAIAALVLLLANPGNLYGLSFQLTFLAVLGIISIHRAFPAVREREEREGASRWQRGRVRIVRFIREGTLMTLGATLLTAPVVLQAFNLFFPASFIANLVVTPMSIVAVVALLAESALLLLGVPFTEIVAQTLDVLLRILAGLATFSAHIPWASFTLPTPSAFQTAVLTGMGLSLIWIRTRRGQIGLSAGLLILFASEMGVRWKDHAPGTLEVSFLDVGQGDAAWIRFPDGRTMLLDAGGGIDQSYDIGRQVIARFLWHERVRTVDAMYLSHPHADHVDGAHAVLKQFNVGELWTSADFPGPDGTGAVILDLTEALGVRRRILHAGEVPWKSEDVKIEVLAPPPSLFRGAYDTTNDNSLVLKISHGKVTMLFPGDIGVTPETWLVLNELDLDTGLLKVPHHGSTTSSSDAFISAVNPEFAVMSVGLHNRYGLPSPEIVQRYGKAGVELLRTDLEGSVRFRSDGQRLYRVPLQ